MSRRLKNCIAAALAVLGAAFVGTGIALGENEIVLRKATGSCKATLHAACADGSSVTAVDMRLPGYVVTKKATA